MRARLLAVDLDGTLLNSQHELCPQNRMALHRAHQAGLKIVLCTGRSFTETRPVIAALGLDLDATVTVGGALVSDARNGRTIERETIPRELAREVVAWFGRDGRPVLWLHDADEAGFDGYVFSGACEHAQLTRWRSKTPCVIREAPAPPADGPEALRLTVLDDREPLLPIGREFGEVFAGRMTHNIIDVPAYGISVIESFVAPVDKWRGIRRLCRRWNVDPADTVAIGDDVNDLAMLRGAGVGIAVANARPEVLDVASRVVASNDNGGVAQAVDWMLSEC